MCKNHQSENKMHVDEIYKQLVEDVIVNGEEREDRTGVGTLSVFGRQCRYDLNEGFPILTTKKVHLKSVVGELLWFLRGDTNVKWLNDHGITIWDEWSTQEQCAKFGRKQGDLGYVYGALWRRWEAIDKTVETGTCEYDITSISSGTEQGLYTGFIDTTSVPWHPVRKVDQIQRVIDQIKTNPSSRRLIVTGWNPGTCDLVTLPPCHTMFQFYVSLKDKLSCQLYQRSCDLGLGQPFNVASYALLTHMIAQVCGLGVGEFVHTFGDLHVYKNHVDKLKQQLAREPFPAPRLWLNPEIKDIDAFTFDDIKLEGYQHHPAIKMEVAV